jgi:putative transposase
MTVTKIRTNPSTINALVAEDKEFLKPLISALQEVLEAEMTEAPGAEKSKRSESRLGYRSGYYSRSLITRVRRRDAAVARGSLCLGRIN